MTRTQIRAVASRAELKINLRDFEFQSLSLHAEELEEHDFTWLPTFSLPFQSCKTLARKPEQACIYYKASDSNSKEQAGFGPLSKGRFKKKKNLKDKTKPHTPPKLFPFPAPFSLLNTVISVPLPHCHPIGPQILFYSPAFSIQEIHRINDKGCLLDSHTRAFSRLCPPVSTDRAGYESRGTSVLGKQSLILWLPFPHNRLLKPSKNKLVLNSVKNVVEQLFTWLYFWISETEEILVLNSMSLRTSPFLVTTCLDSQISSYWQLK